MQLPERRWLHHTPPGWVKDSTFFITVCCQRRGLNQLCTGATSNQLLDAARAYEEQAQWHATIWLLMPDHLHAIVCAPRQLNLTKTIAGWKRFASRKTGVAWQRGFFDHRLRSNESLEEKIHYIRMNPVRKGLVTDPAEWPYVWPGRDTSPRRP